MEVTAQAGALRFALEPFRGVLSAAPSTHFVAMDDDELTELHDPPVLDDLNVWNLCAENGLQRELFEAHEVRRFVLDLARETLLMVAQLEPDFGALELLANFSHQLGGHE